MNDTKGITRDPTCGMQVPLSTSVHADRDGKTYYFCSDQCLERFATLSAGEARTCSESLQSDSKAGPVGTSIPGPASAGASVPAQAN